MTEQNETQQSNPMDTLREIREIANMLDSATLYCDDLNPVFIHTEIGNILNLVDSLLESAQATTQISDRGVSYWLKFCDPLPDVDEKDLMPRSWAISREELGDNE